MTFAVWSGWHCLLYRHQTRLKSLLEPRDLWLSCHQVHFRKAEGAQATDNQVLFSLAARNSKESTIGYPPGASFQRKPVV